MARANLVFAPHFYTGTYGLPGWGYPGDQAAVARDLDLSIGEAQAARLLAIWSRPRVELLAGRPLASTWNEERREFWMEFEESDPTLPNPSVVILPVTVYPEGVRIESSPGLWVRQTPESNRLVLTRDPGEGRHWLKLTPVP